jgi:hypothetical protein
MTRHRSCRVDAAQRRLERVADHSDGGLALTARPREREQRPSRPGGGALQSRPLLAQSPVPATARGAAVLDKLECTSKLSLS